MQPFHTRFALPFPVSDKVVLVVDDIPLVLNVTEAVIKSLGYATEATLSPVEALRKLQGRPDAYCALVTDFSMPELTGLELAREVRKSLPMLPVIFYTGSIDFDLQRDASYLGFTAYLAKPALRNELAEILGAMILESVAASLHADNVKRALMRDAI